MDTPNTVVTNSETPSSRAIWYKMGLLTKLKVLADESRLRLIEILNEGEYNVGTLAERLKLSEPTISHHLSKLHGAGLVTLRMAGTQRFYRLNITGLNQFKAMIAQIEVPATEHISTPSDNRWIDELDAQIGLNAEERHVLIDYTLDGKLIKLPEKQQKIYPILRWVVTLFQLDTFYTEQEVNSILKSVYEKDYVMLRRDLVDCGYMRRERGGGKYWVTPTTADEKER